MIVRQCRRALDGPHRIAISAWLFETIERARSRGTVSRDAHHPVYRKTVAVRRCGASRAPHRSRRQNCAGSYAQTRVDVRQDPVAPHGAAARQRCTPRQERVVNPHADAYALIGRSPLRAAPLACTRTHRRALLHGARAGADAAGHLVRSHLHRSKALHHLRGGVICRGAKVTIHARRRRLQPREGRRYGRTPSLARS
jgi:hypothetical protein